MCNLMGTRKMMADSDKILDEKRIETLTLPEALKWMRKLKISPKGLSNIGEIKGELRKAVQSLDEEVCQ